MPGFKKKKPVKEKPSEATPLLLLPKHQRRKTLTMTHTCTKCGHGKDLDYVYCRWCEPEDWARMVAIRQKIDAEDTVDKIVEKEFNSRTRELSHDIFIEEWVSWVGTVEEFHEWKAERERKLFELWRCKQKRRCFLLATRYPEITHDCKDCPYNGKEN